MNSQSYQNIWSCVLRYVLFAHNLINFFLKKKKAKVGRQRVCTQCVIKVNLFYLMHEFTKAKPDLSIYEPEWGASWNVWDPWIFSFVLWKLQDFPETLYTRREKFSLFISLKSVHEMWLGPLSFLWYPL